jgi:PAT family beta-lactamase induction signal transducer AmpG
MKNTPAQRSPWSWVPSLYFAEGLPYVIVMTVSVIMYKNFNLSNTEIAFYTGWLYLPWVIKPLWSPFVDLFKTKRWWITTMQMLVGIGFAAIAFTLNMPYMIELSLAFFWLMAFASATHDIAADGFYLLAVPDKDEQALFVGIRSTFYRISTIAGQGLLVLLAGYLIDSNMGIATAWTITFAVMAVVFIALFLYHRIMLPRPDSDHATSDDTSAKAILKGFVNTFITFFKKPYALSSIIFMLLYRLPEALLVKMTSPFLLDSVEQGGMGMTTLQVGMATGTVGVIGLTIGGILGGVCASHGGLKRWLWPMVTAISLPNIVYVIMAYTHPALWVVNALIFVEQFGYGFGFTAYMLFLIHYAEGESTTAHYALCTAFMAMGMMIPGMAAGWLQEMLGYQHFFILICILCLVTVGVCCFIKLDKPAKTNNHE